MVRLVKSYLLTNPKSKSKSDLGFSLETHFPSPTPTPHSHPGKVDRVQLGLLIGNKRCLFRLVELHKSVGAILGQNKPDFRSNHK